MEESGEKSIKKPPANKNSRKKNNLPAKIDPKIDVDVQELIQFALKTSDIDKVKEILDLRQRINDEHAERAFRDAMSQFQARCPIIKKEKGVYDKPERGGKLRYKYASIDDIIRQVQPLLAELGLSYDIETKITGKPAGIESLISVYHILGHNKKTSFWVPIDQKAYMTEPQRWASAQTFAKRYAFCNAFGILTGDEDNDANEIPPANEEQNNSSSNKEKPKQEKTQGRAPIKFEDFKFLISNAKKMGETKKVVQYMKQAKEKLAKDEFAELVNYTNSLNGKKKSA